MFILPFERIDAARAAEVGGKGANLGVLVRAGLPVPPGVCLTTAAFDRFLESAPDVAERILALDGLEAQDLAGVAHHAGELRARLLELPVPPVVEAQLLAAWRGLGAEHAYAVRSSATLEDLPDASFAGQQDTFLNVRGEGPLLAAVRACWASLFTDRAVLYRRKHAYRSNAAKLSVVLQRMVLPDVAGILFTADPVTGHRDVCSIDASYGLGEALVSGLVHADLYRVRKSTGELLEARVGDKALGIWWKPQGGTEQRPIPADRRRARALDDEALRRLVALGRQVEQLRGAPQDLEWAIAGGALYLLQARAITSLYPLPEPRPQDGALHVYLSFGHVQVNTSPWTPMGHALLRELMPVRRPERGADWVAQAGGRMFVDITPLLRHPVGRRVIPTVLGFASQLISERVRAVLARPELRAGTLPRARPGTIVAPLLRRVLLRLLRPNPGGARAELEGALEGYVSAARARVQAAPPGAERLRAAAAAMRGLFPEVLLPVGMPLIAGGVISWRLLRKLMGRRVDAATVESLGRGLQGNVTTDMDLELGDLADLARREPLVAQALRSTAPGEVLPALKQRPEAGPFLFALDAFIARYGHRGPGEIDVGTPRWKEDPSTLLTTLAGLLHSEAAGQHRLRHANSLAEAQAAISRLDAAADGGPLGALVRALTRRVRAWLALREHPKFAMVQLLELAREAIRGAGALAAQRGLLSGADDAFWLSLHELQAALEGGGAGALKALVAQRRAAWARYAHLAVPPVLTSEGEAPVPAAQAALPEGTLAGTAVSSGVVEGVAHVIKDPPREVLRAGEILVTEFTDPGWTPLFLNAAGLVMEVGGVMTHGSVVAREYGIPAVVGVERATAKVQTGQRIRVDGDLGRVTVL